MHNGQDKTEYTQFYSSFPYKSYDQLLAEKRRRSRYRRGCFVLCLIFVTGLTLLAFLILLSTRDVEDGGSGTQDDGAQNGVFTPSAQSGEPSESAVIVRDVRDVVKKCSASVVGIVTESYQNLSQSSAGSGFIISADGYIVTNNHVISGVDSITVMLESGENCVAYLIGADAYTDIAVLKIEAEGLQAVELGDSDRVEVGEAAIAIGNPTGQLMGSVTAGVISGVDRNILVNNHVMTLLQTDAAVNQGNSGGPLINEYGQVVGVISAKLSSSTYEGLGFAIPINAVRPIVEELIANGYVSGRPLVGISGRTISAMAAAFYSLPQGVLVDSVEESSDAYTKGIQTGDVIVGVNGERVSGISSAVAQRNQFKAGDVITVSVYRKGTVYDVEITLIEQANLSDDYNF